MKAHDTDNWIVRGWKPEPRVGGLEFEDLAGGDQAPPLWKDLALASVAAVFLWVLAALLVA